MNLNNVTHLTDDDLRVKLAEIRGWTYSTHEDSGTYRSDDPYSWTWFHPTAPRVGCGFGGVPDYPFNFAACHAVEMMLTKEQFDLYAYNLYSLFPVEESGSTSDFLNRACMCASARQRCEALVVTLAAEDDEPEDEQPETRTIGAQALLIEIDEHLQGDYELLREIAERTTGYPTTFDGDETFTQDLT